MSWDPIWEDIYSSGSWGKYPPEELIRFICRSFAKAEDRSAIKILEVGCGAGANLWLTAREGYDSYGIDGSESAITQSQDYLSGEGLSAQLEANDINNLADIYPAEHFDAVIDIACLQHNRIANINSMMHQIEHILKPGGHCFSMMVGEGTWGENDATVVEGGTYKDITAGPLTNRGLIHFSSRDDIDSLYANYSRVNVEYSVRSYDDCEQEYRHWVVSAQK